MRVSLELDIELSELRGAWGTSWSDNRVSGSPSPSGVLCIG